ncbi:MAG TPA: glycosyltransferase family 9 protein [Candidatus Obscuribacterales bacterium]
MSPQDSSKKLLAINFGGLGDEILFLPTLQTIKSQYPSYRIVMLTEPRGKGVSRLTDLIDDSLTFDIKKRPLLPGDYLALIGLLRGGAFDIVLSSGSSPNVAALLFLSGIRRRIGYGSNRLASMLLSDPVPLNRNQHAAMMYHDLTCGLGIKAECARPAVVVRSEAVARMSDWLGRGQGAAEPAGSSRAGTGATVLLHPGTSLLALKKQIFKVWDPRNWAQLIADFIKQAGVRVVLAGGPDDEATIQQIIAALASNHADIAGGANGLFLNAYGKTATVEDLVALIDLSDLMVCVDSAPMHIGVGLGKPMVALFGPTDPRKLLWNDPRFIAIRDPQAAAFYGDRDPFTQRPEHSATSPPAPYVLIPPDTVFQTAMDQLHSTSSGSREFLR